MRNDTLIQILKKPSIAWKLVFGKLVSKDLLNWLPDKFFLKLRYHQLLGEKLDLNNPKTFNEKLQWLKLYDRKVEYIKLVDKYEVREYISEALGDKYLIPSLGVWERIEDIDFNLLPESFVLKGTHDSGSVIVCRNKSNFDMEAAKQKLSASLKRNLFWQGREWPYKNLKPRIIAEKLMQTFDGQDIIDYKFFCFNGEPKFLYVSQGLSDHRTAHISYVSLEWEKEPFYREDFSIFEKLPEKPKTFDKMLEYSKILAKDYPFIRVDFYEINGELYFSELTFFPGAGFTKFYPEEWNEIIGNMIQLPKTKK